VSGTASSSDTASPDPLLAELARLRRLLRGEPAAADEAAATSDRLDTLAKSFRLSDFERAVLLLAAGPELDPDCAGDMVTTTGSAYLTFTIAMRVLPGAHWSAMAPSAPLRRWRLLAVLDPASPVRSALIADERVLHYLVGVDYLDPRVAALGSLVEALRVPAPCLIDAAARVAAAWESGPVVHVAGPRRTDVARVAAAAARALGRDLVVFAPADLPDAPEDREQLLRLLEREALLSGAAWALDAWAADGGESAGHSQALDRAVRALTGIDAPVVVLGSGTERLPPEVPRVDVPCVPAAERVGVLLACLERHPDGHRPTGPSDEEVAAAGAAFDLDVADLEAAAAEAAHGRPVWAACRDRARRRVAGRAAVVEPRRSWDDLVLPRAQLDQLSALVASVRHRTTVDEAWGFAERGGRGLGTAALFTGPSGTGKTLAAEVVAGELGRDLLVVDLSQVVSKYIGETEKNLARVFAAAEDSGAVLLFDEADALFGRRTEVRDSHDRYANVEVGYLLQRVEAFRGLAVLTTNARSAIDPAFLRRLRFVVTFPYPDVAARTELWRRAFPPLTPTDDVAPERLAAIDLPGGGIAAAALTAAYLGAEHGVVRSQDVVAATGWELAKHGRSAAR
jgi:hypothetical protein